jgi:hypothetical protein
MLGRTGGLARASTAWRYLDGTFMPESEKAEARFQEYERYAIGGRARFESETRTRFELSCQLWESEEYLMNRDLNWNEALDLLFAGQVFDSLIKHGGSLDTGSLRKELQRRLGDLLTDADWEPYLKGRKPDPKWWNDTRAQCNGHW